jgi:hypothetical protein
MACNADVQGIEETAGLERQIPLWTVLPVVVYGTSKGGGQARKPGNGKAPKQHKSGMLSALIVICRCCCYSARFVPAAELVLPDCDATRCSWRPKVIFLATQSDVPGNADSPQLRPIQATTEALCCRSTC